MENKKRYKIKNFPGQKHFSPSCTEIYDTEVRCTQCGAPLYVSPEGAVLVLTSLKRMGMAGLICLCGHTEFIDTALHLQTPPLQNHQHS